MEEIIFHSCRMFAMGYLAQVSGSGIWLRMGGFLTTVINQNAVRRVFGTATIMPGRHRCGLTT